MEVSAIIASEITWDFASCGYICSFNVLLVIHISIGTQSIVGVDIQKSNVLRTRMSLLWSFLRTLSYRGKQTIHCVLLLSECLELVIRSLNLRTHDVLQPRCTYRMLLPYADHTHTPLTALLCALCHRNLTTGIIQHHKPRASVLSEDDTFNESGSLPPLSTQSDPGAQKRRKRLAAMRKKLC